MFVLFFFNVGVNSSLVVISPTTHNSIKMKTYISSKSLWFFALALSLVLSSCDKKIRKEGSGVLQTVTRSLDSFSAIDADGKFDITYHVDDDTHVVITTDNNIIEDVHTFVQDGRLVIEMDDDYYNYHFTKMEVEIYAPACNDVDLNGSVEYIMADTVFADEMDVFHNGSGYASIKYSGNNLKMQINGSADMHAAGDATFANYIINGSGKMDGLDLEAYDAKAEIYGSGDIYLNCSHNLNAIIRGSGDIRYIGNPVVSTDISGSGSVGPY